MLIENKKRYEEWLASSLWTQFICSDARYGLPDAMVEVTRNHKQYGWNEIIRQDICAYCQESGGTIDHIEPRLTREIRSKVKKRKKRRHKYRAWPAWDSWLNKTGACSKCNGDKTNKKFLFVLLDENELAVPT